VRQIDQVCKHFLGEGIALPSCGVEQVVTESSQHSVENEVDEIFPSLARTESYSSDSDQNSSKSEDETSKAVSSKSGSLTIRPHVLEKDKKIEIIVHPTGFRAYMEEFGAMNRCTLMDTLLSHRIELVEQFIELINAMVHNEYENRYPLWAEEIRDIRTQLYKIDSRWDLKLIKTQCGHVLIRQYDCTCDPPFNYWLTISKRETPRLNKPKIPTIDELIEKRRALVGKLFLIVEDQVIDGYYPQFDLSWVIGLRKIAQQILDIDPQWKLEFVKEQFKCLKIRRVSCNCGHQK
jgi:hypothetical protein